jgi:hypothetical protein
MYTNFVYVCTYIIVYVHINKKKQIMKKRNKEIKKNEK